MPKFSIIIPTTGRDPENQILKCLEAVRLYTGVSGEKKIAETIVVLNGGLEDDPCAARYEIERRFRFASIVDLGARVGYAKAVNAGIEKSKGGIVVLLNDDAFLLPQKKDQWLRQLEAPFLDDPEVGITGPLVGYSGPADANFVVFFVAAIGRAVINKIGYLDTAFGEGGGEDTDYCVRAVHAGFKIKDAIGGGPTTASEGIVSGDFPIFHKGEATVGAIPNWKEIFDKNSETLARRYNRKWVLSNNCERAVIGADDTVPPRENARYSWAAREIKPGATIIELGCSSGYGWRYFRDIPGVDYLGIDKDEKVLEFAREQFPGVRFISGDIPTEFLGSGSVNLGPVSGKETVVAFEVLEHLEKGREVAASLREKFARVLFTVPYNETPGTWGAHHKLHHLTEADFPGYSFRFMTGDGRIISRPNGDPQGLLLGEFPPRRHVTAVVPTLGRNATTLPLTLQAILFQTRTPDRLLVVDDGDHKNLLEIPTLAYLFRLADEKGVDWAIEHGPGRGQHVIHQHSQDVSPDLIWRVDDDESPEPGVLAALLDEMGDRVGAVGGLVLTPPVPPASRPPEATGKIGAIDAPSPQWFRGPGGKFEVEHLHSTFLYKKGLAEYEPGLSRAAHREETLFTHSIHRAGFRLLVDPSVVTWHFRNPEGGIRQGHGKEMFDSDENLFRRKLAEWSAASAKRALVASGKKPKKVFFLELGLGDHYAFRFILPELRAKFGKPIFVATPYPEVFDGLPDVVALNLGDGLARGGDPKENVYLFMAAKNWHGSLLEAFRSMYGLVPGGRVAGAIPKKRSPKINNIRAASRRPKGARR